MTPSLMTPLTRRAFASLPAPAKREFEAWFRNQIQILAGTNNLEADDDRLSHTVRGFARQRQRAAELAIDSLHEIFAVDHNAHLGAKE